MIHCPQSHRKWDTPVPPTNERMGDFALDTFGFYKEHVWVGTGIAYLLGLYFLLSAALAFALSRVTGGTRRAQVTWGGSIAYYTLLHCVKAPAATRTYQPLGSIPKRGLDIPCGKRLTPCHLSHPSLPGP